MLSSRLDVVLLDPLCKGFTSQQLPGPTALRSDSGRQWSVSRPTIRNRNEREALCGKLLNQVGFESLCCTLAWQFRRNYNVHGFQIWTAPDSARARPPVSLYASCAEHVKYGLSDQFTGYMYASLSKNGLRAAVSRALP